MLGAMWLNRLGLKDRYIDPEKDFKLEKNTTKNLPHIQSISK